MSTGIKKESATIEQHSVTSHRKTQTHRHEHTHTRALPLPSHCTPQLGRERRRRAGGMTREREQGWGWQEVRRRKGASKRHGGGLKSKRIPESGRSWSVNGGLLGVWPQHSVCAHGRVGDLQTLVCVQRFFFFQKHTNTGAQTSGSSRGNSPLRVRQRDLLAVRGILLFHHTTQTGTKARRMLSSSAEEKIDISSSRFQQANNNKWDLLPPQTDKQNTEADQQTAAQGLLHCQEIFSRKFWARNVSRYLWNQLRSGKALRMLLENKVLHTFKTLCLDVWQRACFDKLLFNVTLDTSGQLGSICKLIRASQHGSNYRLSVILYLDIS